MIITLGVSFIFILAQFLNCLPVVLLPLSVVGSVWALSLSAAAGAAHIMVALLLLLAASAPAALLSACCCLLRGGCSIFWRQHSSNKNSKRIEIQCESAKVIYIPTVCTMYLKYHYQEANKQAKSQIIKTNSYEKIGKIEIKTTDVGE